MTTAEILSLISTICYVIAAISFVLAVFFWFSFKIPSVIGDLSGRTAKKSIARMRASNERAGGQGYRPSATNMSRGKLTGTMQHSGKLADGSKKPADEPKKTAPPGGGVPETEVLEANRAVAADGQQTAPLDSSETTALLDSTETTALLDGTETTALLDGSEATALLVDEGDTAPLQEESRGVVAGNDTGKLRMLDEVMLIHTNEVIS